MRLRGLLGTGRTRAIQDREQLAHGEVEIGQRGVREGLVLGVEAVAGSIVRDKCTRLGVNDED
jgi:hypothetical protein